MKILHLNPGVFDKGGIARYNRFQIRALRETFGSESVRVFSLMGREYGDFEDPFDVDFAGAMPLGMPSKLLFAVEALRASTTFRPDIVLASHVNLGPLAMALAKMFYVSTVTNIYGRELWGEKCLSLGRRTALARADMVISDCHNTADRAVEIGLVKTKPKVVWDCVDTNRYFPKEPDWNVLRRYGLKDSGRFRVMFLGRINEDSRYKGFERMLRLVSMLPAQDFEAVISGNGNGLGCVKSLIKELGIGDRATITGPIHEADMPDVYRCADAFYLVSEVGPGMGEGIPLTPMEAMSCGVPVLVGNQDGSRELIDGEGGWCGEPQDLEGQKGYLEKLNAVESFRREECNKARERAADKFCYSRFEQKTTESIREVYGTPCI